MCICALCTLSAVLTLEAFIELAIACFENYSVLQLHFFFPLDLVYVQQRVLWVKIINFSEILKTLYCQLQEGHFLSGGRANFCSCLRMNQE